MVCGLINVCYYYEWLYARSLSGLIAVYVHDISNGTSRRVVFHTSLAPRLMVFHVSCYSTSRENEDFHGNFLNFTCKYLHVTMRGPPRVSEVTLELYRIKMAQIENHVKETIQHIMLPFINMSSAARGLHNILKI